MIIKDGNCEKCEHWALCDDGTNDRVCEFDGECENMIREQTNEEWIKSCSTEELAEWLSIISGYEGICTICDVECDSDSCRYHHDVTDAQAWVEWLQEKHI